MTIIFNARRCVNASLVGCSTGKSLEGHPQLSYWSSSSCMKDAAKGQVVLAPARTCCTVYTSALGYVHVVLMTLPEGLVASPQFKVHRSSEEMDYPCLRMEIPHHYCILWGGHIPCLVVSPVVQIVLHVLVICIWKYVLGPITGQHMNKYTVAT